MHLWVLVNMCTKFRSNRFSHWMLWHATDRPTDRHVTLPGSGQSENVPSYDWEHKKEKKSIGLQCSFSVSFGVWGGGPLHAEITNNGLKSTTS